MARRKKRNRSAQRDISYVANSVAVRPIRSTAFLEPDLRRWHPDPVAAVFSFNRPHARLTEQPNVNVRKPAARGTKLRFAVPEKVSICVRRKSRREVLFALRRTGKGSKSKRHRTVFSSYEC